MSWVCRYRRRTFLRSSLCVVPIACMLAGLLAAPLIRWVDDQTRWTLMGFGPEGGQGRARGARVVAPDVHRLRRACDKFMGPDG
jgi:hypothetical protein